MQTFLPYASFEESARCLDRSRLGKQRLEARGILEILNGAQSGWWAHPAVLMWRGYPEALAAYGRAVTAEWQRRGYRNSLVFTHPRRFAFPPWFGRKDFHSSHRSNLLRKHPVWYGQFGWLESDDQPYTWPVRRIT